MHLTPASGHIAWEPTHPPTHPPTTHPPPCLGTHPSPLPQDLLWNKYWVATLSASPLLATRELLAGQLADICECRAWAWAGRWCLLCMRLSIC